MAEDSISILAYGGPGSGKTTLGLTGPTPILMLDVETASRFIPRNRRVYWNPEKGEAIPDLSGKTDPVVVVRTPHWTNVEPVMQYLRSHNHPFRTVLIDSISELIVKAKDNISKSQFKIQDWGTLGRTMGDMLRELRDIAADPDSPIEMLYMISIARHIASDPDKGTSDRWEPLLEGSTKSVAPYLFDLTALISLEMVPSDPNNIYSEKVKVQSFYTGSSDPNVVGKSRIPGLPEKINGLTLVGLLRNIFGEGEPDPEPAPPKKESAPAKKTSSTNKNDDPGVPTLPGN